MRRLYSPSDIQVHPDELWAFAWSAPMRDLAAKLTMSDVGLKKLLTSYGVVAPPRGYWNKVHANARVPKRPTAPPRKPGQTGRYRLDKRFDGLLPSAPPLSAQGPFASPHVPESLAALYAIELKSLGKVGVAKTLANADAALSELLKQEARRRDKVAASGWHWDEPKFDTPVAKRQLRILDAIFRGLRRRGHHGQVHERDGELNAGATIGDTYVGISISIKGASRPRHRHSESQAAAKAAPASTPLIVQLQVALDAGVPAAWEDDSQGRIEAKVPSITAAIITSGEACFRQSLAEAEARSARDKVRAEQQRIAELEERNKRRVSQLLQLSEELRRADDLRALVANIEQRIGRNDAEGDSKSLQLWKGWALGQADRLDPIKSGKALAHVRDVTCATYDNSHEAAHAET